MRKTLRQLGRTIGRFPTGKRNDITDVKGIAVGHKTNIKDIEEKGKKRYLRTGITAVYPSKDIFRRYMAAGAFVLNGIGEFSGISQINDWGWLTTPILLTNTMSIGKVHQGMISYIMDKHPHIFQDVEVVIPLVAETDDSFLNDVTVDSQNSAQDAVDAIASATAKKVEQGSVGAGTGMLSFDFSGGIGSSSRALKEGNIGVLVLSNFGKMRNLTIDGRVVGRKLDDQYPKKGRRESHGSSVIVIIALDIPLLPVQLKRVAKRASIGLGRVGSFAASSSGEFAIAFSTSNRIRNVDIAQKKYMDVTFLQDSFIDNIYEATAECVEEAVVNSIFCSEGIVARNRSWPISHEKVLELLE